MNKADRKCLEDYLRATADRMRLKDWKVELDKDPSDDGKAGAAYCVDGQSLIVVSVSNKFRDEPPEEQRNTIVHELLHAHHERCWRMVQSDLTEPLGKVAYYVFCDAYRRNMEHCIDALSCVIDQNIPLIDWPKS